MIRVLEYEHPKVTFASLAAAAPRPSAGGRAVHRLRGSVAGQRLSRGRPRLGPAGGRRARGELVSRAAPKSALYTGTVMHARRSPRDNVFRYPVYMALIDLDELPQPRSRAASLRLEPARRHELPRRRPHRHPRGALGQRGRARRRRLDPGADESARARVRLQPGLVLVVSPGRRHARVHRGRGQQHVRRAAAVRAPPRATSDEAGTRAVFETDKRLHVSPFMPMDQALHLVVLRRLGRS